MQDLTDEAAVAVQGRDDHAEIIALMTSDAWNQRLDEARSARSRVLAKRNRPTTVSVFRRNSERPARRDLLPPLEPADRSSEGKVIQLVTPVFRAPEQLAVPAVVGNIVPEEQPRRRIALLLATGFGAGLALGVALSLLV